MSIKGSFKNIIIEILENIDTVNDCKLCHDLGITCLIATTILNVYKETRFLPACRNTKECSKDSFLWLPRINNHQPESNNIN